MKDYIPTEIFKCPHCGALFLKDKRIINDTPKCWKCGKEMNKEDQK